MQQHAGVEYTHSDLRANYVSQGIRLLYYSVHTLILIKLASAICRLYYVQDLLLY